MFSQNCQLTTNPPRTGVDILRDPLVNKGVSFSRMQRQNFKLTGLMPALVDTATPSEISYQERLAMERLHHLSSDLDKYDYLLRLYDTDRTHFFRMMNKNVEELTPLVYTPTVGAACQNYALVHAHGRWLIFRLLVASLIVFTAFPFWSLQQLLDDPLYFGLRQKRVTGDAYDNFVAEFMRSCAAV
ncbi:unnamed protein product [Schistocephalus solidus]|uniref:Malic domain-containing protein n=1 Tax=Schistocephalus solidus TaxID=70667 RepID=A0A183TQF9_SCHSO|nr:unnamed protein product [Schistocephalus solidus]